MDTMHLLVLSMLILIGIVILGVVCVRCWKICRSCYYNSLNGAYRNTEDRETIPNSVIHRRRLRHHTTETHKAVPLLCVQYSHGLCFTSCPDTLKMEIDSNSSSSGNESKIPDMAVYSSDSDEMMDPQMTSAPAYTSQYTSPVMHGATSSLGTPNFTLSTICNTPCNTPVLSRQGTSHWNESGTPEVCLNSRNRCCVCYDMDINAFLVPCAHKFCFPCATRVKTTGQPCPICRTVITNVGSLVSSDM